MNGAGEGYAREIGGRAAAGARARLAEKLAEHLPGVAVTQDGDGVVLTGRGLRRRFLTDATLRWSAGVLR